MAGTALAKIDDSADWVRRIKGEWRKTFESVLETGRLISAAKDALDHGEFGTMIESELPFGKGTAQRLMKISADERLANPAHAPLLPPSWMALYELTKLDDEAFSARVDDGTINAGMQRKDISVVVKKAARKTREIELAAKQVALPDSRYGVIYADPEWQFEPYSRDTGMDRAADNHYPTSNLEAIKARPVADIAADDCVLFLWATAPMLPQAIEVMAAWGFEYKSHIIWRKAEFTGAADYNSDKRDRGHYSGAVVCGTGYWSRNCHELLLIGTRGKVPAPAMGEQFPSVIDWPPLRHSQKPDRFAELIEQYFPTLPKIELNRRGAPRADWEAWGNEAAPAHLPGLEPGSLSPAVDPAPKVDPGSSGRDGAGEGETAAALTSGWEFSQSMFKPEDRVSISNDKTDAVIKAGYGEDISPVDIGELLGWSSQRVRSRANHIGLGDPERRGRAVTVSNRTRGKSFQPNDEATK